MSGGMWSQYLREDLAASEHDQWRTWASYMLSHMTLENVLRWLRQSRTDYADLPPAEQRSDHQFVERTLDILERHGVVAPPLDDHERRLTRLEDAVRASCRVHADICPHGTSEVIVCGELAGRDYVHIFRVADGSVPEVIRMLKSLGRTVPIGRVDAPLPRGFML